MNCPVHNFPLKDDRGCWKCLDELRIEGKLEEKENKPKKLYHIPKMTEKKKRREADLAKLRKPKKRLAKSCQSCDDPEGPLDYSHILSVGQYPEFESHPLNGVVECRKCHMIWENGTLEEKKAQKSWPIKETVIRFLAPNYLDKLTLKQAS